MNEYRSAKYVCHKGAHLITGAVMLNGVACGMIYRPLKATTRRRDIGTRASDTMRRSTVHRSALAENQYIRPASVRSLSVDGTALAKDTCFVAMKVSDPISRSMHAVNDVVTSLTNVSNHFSRKFISYNQKWAQVKFCVALFRENIPLFQQFYLRRLIVQMFKTPKSIFVIYVIKKLRKIGFLVYMFCLCFGNCFLQWFRHFNNASSHTELPHPYLLCAVYLNTL